ncbi:aldehyde dehydrogenase family protein, partial [Pseudomonas sp. RTB3]|uniref:aldehyde dehydrogenase family protein n=1 Tax=Pseudomonas sp. RTB3 TaxID=3048633 RepID=UPI002B2292D6
ALAEILTQEQGKPLAEASGKVIYPARYNEWFAEEPKPINRDTKPSHNGDARIVVSKEPIAVVPANTTSNLPAANIKRKAGPALAPRSPSIVKP